MAFDAIVTKAISTELQLLSGARIDKIFEPDKNEVILGFYLNGINYALNISIDPKNYRVNLTTNLKKNSKEAPNFCMVLRKHLIGLHIKNIITNNLERIITIEFEGFDEIDDIISKKLVIELMGKHCNIILLDDENIIIDSLRHINSENSLRTILPHIKYISPKTDKYNFLECLEFKDFYNKLPSNIDILNISSIISSLFNGISKSFLDESINQLNIKEVNVKTLETLYNYINEIINNTDNLKLKFQNIFDDKKNVKDYFLTVSKDYTPFSLNFFIDDFYYKKETAYNFKTYRDSILKMILEILKKYKKRLYNIDEKLKSCDNMQIYKLYGELIIANLYKIKDNNLEFITLENYYNNNEEITIPLDKRFSASLNAKNYFKKYNKLKNTLEVVTNQKQETLKKLDYIESIVYELENCKTIEEVSQIYEEISENVIFKEKTNKYKKQKNIKVKKTNLTKNKEISFNPLKYSIGEFTLLVGRNNKENDYLTLKYANNSDLWFHTKDIHGSHAILLLRDTNIVPNEVLVKCAEITAYHSKARNSSNAPVDYCYVKFVKKPKLAKPGMVIYSNNKTLYVEPKI